MHAIILHSTGGPDQLHLEEVPEPQAGPGEAVVRLKAAALNHRDVWIRRGLYAGIKLPMILGSDGAGVVESIGEGVVASLAGSSVLINPSLNWGDDGRAQGPEFNILGLPRDGTYAAKVAVPVVNLHPVPEGFSWEEAAAIPLASLTAYRALVSRARLNARNTLVITGIGGGVSTFGLLIARQLGAKVLVTSGSNAKLERARLLGAEAGVNYRDADWDKQLLALSEGKGPDIVLDSVGGETLARCISLLKPGGCLVTYGATTGLVKEFNLRQVFWKQLTILGSTMGSPEEFSEMLKLYGSGGIKPVLDQIFPLSEAAEAHRRMEEAEQFGKIVLRIE
jgi:NADPH:quinone reductase-like Zn-dependent oxidoreductase